MRVRMFVVVMKEDEEGRWRVGVGEVGVKATTIATWAWGSSMIKGRHGISTSLSPSQDDD